METHSHYHALPSLLTTPCPPHSPRPYLTTHHARISPLNTPFISPLNTPLSHHSPRPYLTTQHALISALNTPLSHHSTRPYLSTQHALISPLNTPLSHHSTRPYLTTQHADTFSPTILFFFALGNSNFPTHYFLHSSQYVFLSSFQY
ncbi:hypothetical protein Pmani_037210 [Petrolisthes manimaculis]|uniref:Uncharacterized protein n=1 Tax=Petrolisthes manimaculis TaxID=1843537 RepID=A0AAE1TLN5_9EUCA|nr:hypothetical protein Pmani_037210 [Petrolisthes manimaculis]